MRLFKWFEDNDYTLVNYNGLLSKLGKKLKNYQQFKGVLDVSEYDIETLMIDTDHSVSWKKVLKISFEKAEHTILIDHIPTYGASAFTHFEGCLMFKSTDLVPVFQNETIQYVEGKEIGIKSGLARIGKLSLDHTLDKYEDVDLTYKLGFVLGMMFYYHQVIIKNDGKVTYDGVYDGMIRENWDALLDRICQFLDDSGMEYERNDDINDKQDNNDQENDEQKADQQNETPKPYIIFKDQKLMEFFKTKFLQTKEQYTYGGDYCDAYFLADWVVKSCDDFVVGFLSSYSYIAAGEHNGTLNFGCGCNGYGPCHESHPDDDSHDTIWELKIMFFRFGIVSGMRSGDCDTYAITEPASFVIFQDKIQFQPNKDVPSIDQDGPKCDLYLMTIGKMLISRESHAYNGIISVSVDGETFISPPFL